MGSEELGVGSGEWIFASAAGVTVFARLAHGKVNISPSLVLLWDSDLLLVLHLDLSFLLFRHMSSYS